MKSLEKIRKYVVEVGECWEWVGGYQSCGSTPTMRYNERPMSVRRVICIERGDVVKGLYATYTCKNPKCVNPEHTAMKSRAWVQRETASINDSARKPERRALLRKMARLRAVLNENLVAEIRASTDSQRPLAKRYSVSQATISKIKRHELWIDSRSPWTQLMGTL